ncbi:choice-of-anchor B family protein [Nonomuraea sp. NBC_00507]|uniref:choice-of-anchor B family protein n=1 Tax=Nonomuraea sp. NBC_00507 TaxID=2976002 RepID=UPI002E17B77F
MRPRTRILPLLACLLIASPGWTVADPDPHDGKSHGWQPAAPQQAQALAATPCVGGSAAGYPCNKVDLMAQLPLNTIGGGSGNDIWGWTDPQTGREYALVGRSSGTSFVDVTNPAAPVYLGNLPTATVNSSWRDIEVHNNHAYIVSEASGHGLQVFNLTRLRNVTSPPVTFTADARNTSFSTAHTITINTQTGFAYVNGSNTCSGGPRMFNLATPANPVFAGCVSADGYTHDSQAVIYNGPDTRYTGREILLNSNEDTLTIFDVTTKSAPVQLSRTTYSGRGYTHQGWLTEDHRYFFLNDETDEQNFGHNTRTRVFSMANLTSVSLLGFYSGPTAAIDHNLYIKGKYVYESNYTAGLRILDSTNAANPATITEAAFFDVHPANNNATFNGTWANYPFFNSGTVIVNSIERGLFVLKPNLDGPPPVTVYSDDFESATGWTPNPAGSDTATAGQWERGDPEATSSGGTSLQQGTTVSGANDLVTGRLAGSSAGTGDIDGGTTSIQSPAITLPASGPLTLSFSYSFAHLNNASSADFFRVRIVAAATSTVFQQTGAASARSGAWTSGSADLSSFAGQTIRILIEAGDAAGGSLVEAAVDDVRITQ